MRRLVLLHTCLVLCSLALIGLLASPVGLFASMFLFDAPGSFNPVVIALALGLWSFPVTAAMGGINGIRGWRARNLRSALGWTALAYSSVLLLAIALWLLEAVCGGKFQCP
jgi:hypothetical protein